jgi:hypothetical protein
MSKTMPRASKSTGSQKIKNIFEDAGVDDMDPGDEESRRRLPQVKLEIKQSLYVTAGRGLFNNGDGIISNQWIAPFGGEIIAALPGKSFESQIHGYIMEVGGVIVDCGTYECGFGRFMNDPFDEHKSNVKCELRDGVIWMRAVTFIPHGAELLLSYGESYWRVHMRFLSPCDQKKCRDGYKM